MRACCAPPNPACHDTMHCIVTQHQNGPHSRFHCTIFFFTSFFFLIPATGKPPKKYFFFFHFPIEPNKFIKIYFNFFPSFTPCKTSKKKNFFSLFFFPMCYSLSTQTIQFTTQQLMLCTPFTHKTQCMQCSNHVP